jgi:hypothetical protein
MAPAEMAEETKVLLFILIPPAAIVVPAGGTLSNLRRDPKMKPYLPTSRVAMLVACLTLSCAAPGGGVDSSAAIDIRTEDVDRFYDLYERTRGKPTAAELQQFYVEPGSEGLQHLMKMRSSVNAERIAKALVDQPGLYTHARTCLAALPLIRERLRQTFENLLRLYPEASRPPITILISRGRPVAIAGPGAGVQVSLEALCSETAARFLGADINDRFVYLIAHEYVHVQQAPEVPNPTVLERALVEGVAEFVGELISGGVSNEAVHLSARGREREIEEKFAAEQDQKDLSAWFDNTTEKDVGQLGYWVGYRIAKAYYLSAKDRQAAIRDMIRMTDTRDFLARSGWRPGLELGRQVEKAE